MAAAAEYTVVVVQSITGGAAFIGAPVKDGMVLAAEEINRKQELGAGLTAIRAARLRACAVIAGTGQSGGQRQWCMADLNKDTQP